MPTVAEALRSALLYPRNCHHTPAVLPIVSVLRRPSCDVRRRSECEMGNRCCARSRPVELLRRGREDSSGIGKLLSSTARLSLNLRNPGRVAVVGFALVLAQLGLTSALA